MSSTTDDLQRRKAEEFRALHTNGELLLLPCAWDVASARVFEAEGYRAIGTTSLGVAGTFGRNDGQQLGFRDLLAVVRRIADAVRVPVSVDVEAGYATTGAAVAENMREVLRAGAIGINIEDEDHARTGGGLLEPVAHMVEKIERIREMSDAYGVPLFINAKTDAIWLRGANEAEPAMREAIERANAYAAAGADCIFVTGDLDAAAIERLVAAIDRPLNLVIKDSTPPVPELHRLGVARLSMGSGPMRAAMGLTRTIAREVIANGTYRSMLDHAIPFDEAKTLFAGTDDTDR